MKLSPANGLWLAPVLFWLLFDAGALFSQDNVRIAITRLKSPIMLVGRLGPWDLGFLDMQTARVDDHPSENFGVFRMRRQVFNSYLQRRPEYPAIS